jgi:hypothetical protein
MTKQIQNANERMNETGAARLLVSGIGVWLFEICLVIGAWSLVI